MKRVMSCVAMVSIIALLSVASAAQTNSETRPQAATYVAGLNEVGAPLFDDLGDHHHKITASTEAQRYFDQGLTLAYGFNHGEAIRSFKEGARLDPGCAMCYWGVALVMGPNINKPMDAGDVPLAWEALQQAKRLAPKVSPGEQAYIKALEARYAPQSAADRHALDVAYADAMRDVMKNYPRDLDAATLFAEALMDTMPWDYYMEDRRPKALTAELISALEHVIAVDPRHPGANHLYIHAVEASPYPERALPSAARLRSIAPGAGHLVHMPSHVYLRVGRYHDASIANEQAVLADESYITQCRDQGFYPAAYYPHNLHFLWYTSSVEGRSEVAINTAREIDRMNEHQSLAEGKRFSPLVILTLARFGKWDEVVKEPRPPADQLFGVAMDHYARGMAYAGMLDFDAAQKELSALERITRSAQIKGLDDPTLPGAQLIVLSRHVLAGELAGRRGEAAEMNRQFTTAIQLEDKLPYMEPPYWHHPVRQMFGAALLKVGKAAEAESVYREDLKRNPNNGWSLYGLLASLRSQGKAEEAKVVEKRFREAWRLADVALTASRF